MLDSHTFLDIVLYLGVELVGTIYLKNPKIILTLVVRELISDLGLPTV